MGNGILVICEQENGAFKKTAYELLSKARELTSGLGGTVDALVLGDSDGGNLGEYGASTIYVATGDGIGRKDTGALARATQAAIEAATPLAVLAPASAIMKDILPRIAARCDLGLGTEITALEIQDGGLVATRPMYAGKVLGEIQISSRPALFTVRANSFAVEAGAGSGDVSSLSYTLEGADEASTVIDQEVAQSTVADLTEANRIVSGGRAVKSAENYDALIRPLASAAQATPGASRAAVDAHYAPHSHQVGQTGKVVNPSLYVACGISGAIQHLAGMRTSKVIVAINTDADAPIFEHATYGIVGDIFEVCPKLTSAIQSLN